MDREAFLKELEAAATPKTTTIAVPEWGVTFTVRQLSAETLVNFKDTGDDEKLSGARQMVSCIVDDLGVPLFTHEDIPKLMGYTANGFIRLNTAINEFLGNLVTVEKNSEASHG